MVAEEKLFNKLKTGLIIIDLDSAELISAMNLSAITLLGLDQSAINSNDLNKLQPNLAKLLQEIKKQEIKINGSSKKLELNTNGIYLSVSLSKLEEKQILIELTKMIQKDLGKTTHELKRPIQNIKTLTETLLLGAKDDPNNCDKFLTNINNEVDRLGSLVTDLLRLSYLETGTASINKSNINAKSTIDKIIESLKTKAQEKNITINNSLDSELNINADKDLIEHAFENLIENAIKYNKENGTVDIKQEGEELVISDTGIGLDEKDLSKIFDQYYRADESSKIPGTGLGLSIVKAIFELHGGSIDLESKTNVGTKFKLRL